MFTKQALLIVIASLTASGAVVPGILIRPPADVNAPPPPVYGTAAQAAAAPGVILPVQPGAVANQAAQINNNVNVQGGVQNVEVPVGPTAFQCTIAGMTFTFHDQTTY
jgi:hypothetical protein